MTNQQKESIKKAIEDFQNRRNELSPRDAELILINILTPLLGYEGFNLDHTGGKGDNGIDFLATKGELKVGIEYKHFKSKVGANEVRSLIGSAIINRLDKVILLTNSSFTNQARQITDQVDPIAVELLDIDDLKNWTAKIEADYNESEVIQVLKNFTQKIIELVNKNSSTLDEIEWRDLERVVAEIFSGIGFKVTLTPGSKDGGKDVILECVSQGSQKSFIIEIKHWRSTQKVGQKAIKDFVKVITKEKRERGLFLSTYGYTENAVESLTEIEKQKVRFGDKTKIVSLCKTYIKKKSGLWQSEKELPEILFEGT